MRRQQPLWERLHATRRHAAPPLQSNLTREIKKDVMTTTLTYIKAQEHTNDLEREAHRHRGCGEVRRMAVIRPAGSHFKLLPVRASLEATGG